MRHRFSLMASAVAIAGASPAVQAQAASVELDEIVVSAAGHEQEMLQAPASIGVISRSDIENRSYRDVTDVIEDLPGVVVSGGGSRKDITIRGLPAQYTVLMVDGRNVSGRESQPNGSSALEQGWLPPLEAIERIEVIRGPMSTLYGSDAVGGVINVITRKSSDSWRGTLRAETVIQENSDSGDEYRTQVNTSGPLVEGLLGLQISAAYSDRGEDDIERGFSGNELSSYQAALDLTPTANDSFTLTYAGHEQEKTSTSGESLPASSSSSETNNNRQAMSLGHSGSYSSFTTDSFFQNESVENEGRDITIENRTARSQVSLPVRFHILSLGVGYEDNELQDETTNAGSLTRINNEQWSVFAEDEWLLSDSFTLTLGARLDDNDQYASHISPRVYGVWNINEAWTLKSGVSTGYRTPDLRELSPNWIQESRGGDIYGNPDLEPETSVNTELGFYYRPSRRFQANMTVFHNSFDDKLMVVACPQSICGPSTARYNINVDTAETRGVELGISAQVLPSLTLDASLTNTRSKQTSGDNEGQPLTQIPEHLLVLNARWRINETTNSWLKVNHRGKESEPTNLQSRSTTQAPATTVTDFGGAWHATENVEVQAGIYNIFNESQTYDEFGYVGDGRRYWLALNIGFGAL